MMASCCPPNSLKYLAATYDSVGEKICLPNTHEMYVTGNKLSKNALILIPDIWGWNSGRIRNVADQFANEGYLCLIPKLLVPSFEGGTDGDGFPPSFDFATRGGDFGPYISQVSWNDVLAPRIASSIDYLKGLGVEKIGMIGFCWGSWVATHAAADEQLVSHISCMIFAHPSVTLEQRVFQRSVDDLMARVKSVPVLLMPAGNDPDEYREGGSIYEALKAKHAGSETTGGVYADMTHGWMIRGDVVADDAVRKQVVSGLDAMSQFLIKFM